MGVGGGGGALAPCGGGWGRGGTSPVWGWVGEGGTSPVSPCGGWWSSGLSLMVPELQGTLLADKFCPFFVFYLPPPPPVHPAVNWYLACCGANYGSFSLIRKGPGGASGAHATCCAKVACPPASS